MWIPNSASSTAWGRTRILRIGLAGGGFADSYNEIRDGTYYQSESFEGNGAEISASVYHLFNPGDVIPLNFILRGTAHYSDYNRDNDTAPGFSTAEQPRRFQRAHRPALGRRRADAVPAAGDGIVRLV